MLVYKITNTVNGKAYIGVTVSKVNLRWNQHVHAAKKSDYPLQRAILKYGRDAFAVEVLYEASSLEEMMRCERALIATHGTMLPSGYNLTTGGEGFAGKRSPETRRKMSDARRRLQESGWKRTPHVYTDEQKARISAANKGRIVPPELRQRISETLKANESVQKQVRELAALNHQRNRGRITPPEEKAKVMKSRRENFTATCKLTVEKVREIKSLQSHGKKDREISEIFGVNPQTILNIRLNRTWRDVSPSNEVSGSN